MDNEFTHESQDIVIGNDCGRFVVSVKVEAGSNDFVTLPIAVWNYGAIVSALIRHKYSENEVEAIVSNCIMLMQNPSSVSEEESNEKMNEFNEGHWFLMSSGEMARCSWYAIKGYDDASAPHAIFAKPWADLRFREFSNTWYWLSSEYSELNSWGLNPVSGQFSYGDGAKYVAFQVRAAVAFKL